MSVLSTDGHRLPIVLLSVDCPEWMARGACLGADPDIFFPEKDGEHTTYAQARPFCQRCDVMAECRAYAVRHKIKTGMWGGTAPGERFPRMRGPRQ